MNRSSRIFIALAGAATLVLVGYLAGIARRPAIPEVTSRASRRPASDRRVLYWFDPMKPELHFDHPGKSPFMDMQLEPRYAEESPVAAAGLIPAGLSVVKLPLERRQEIGVTTARVEQRKIDSSVETNGIVAEDEGKVHSINAKFSGYVEKLIVDSTGSAVRRGQPLMTIYSPELVATERELLLALENTRRLKNSSSAEAAADAQSLLSATWQRLELWDISNSQIEQIKKSGEVVKTVTLDSPVSGVVLKKDVVAGLAISAGAPLYTIADLSTVWILADVYQSELAVAAPGSIVSVSGSDLPGGTLRGRVDFIYPTLSEDTRTGKIRIVVPNPGMSLKPGMFVRVSVAGRSHEAVTLPRSALIATGQREIAFVETSPGVFAPREVKIGISGKDFVEVISGVAIGEMVVTSANFLIDSESRIGALGTAPAGAAGQPLQPLSKNVRDEKEPSR